MARYPVLPQDLETVGSEYGHPWSTVSSRVMPEKLHDLFRLSEKIWHMIPEYRHGLQLIVRYFLTDIEIQDASEAEAGKWRDVFNIALRIPDSLTLVGDDYLTYGNSFTSVYLPFHRALICPKCHTYYPAEAIDYRMQTRGKELLFIATCANPNCKYKGPFAVVDLRDKSPQRLRIKRWSPYEIEIEYNPVTDVRNYYWRPPKELKRRLSSGDKFMLDTTPLEVLQAVAQDQYLQLLPGLLQHMRTDTLAGIDTGGWGIPPIVASFGRLWQLQLLYKCNELIALSYLFPMRVISPATYAPPTSEIDPMLHGVGGSFVGEKIMTMIQEHRKDPTAWFFSPIPLKYEPIGIEGSRLLRPDVLRFISEDTITGLGVPIQFYRGNLEWRSTPEAVRLMERKWEHLTAQMRLWLQGIADRIAAIMGWPKTTVLLRPPSIADDLLRKRLLLELESVGKISRRTAYAQWGIDPLREARIRMQEDRELQEEMQEIQASMQPQAPAGGEGETLPVESGGFSQMAAPVSMGVSEFYRRAQEIAAQLMSAPETVKDSQLRQLAQQNRALHAMVKVEMERIRRQTNMIGGVQVREQMFGRS